MSEKKFKEGFSAGPKQKMMYFIIKSSRVFEGRGYKGASSNFIGMTFEKKEDAEKAKAELEKVNSVGWKIIET